MFQRAGKTGQNSIRVALSLMFLLFVGAQMRGDQPRPALAAGSGWFRVRQNLSQSTDRTSGWPRIALGRVGSDDRYVAVVWSEEVSGASVHGSKGHVYLRWVDEAGGGWSDPVTIDSVTVSPDINNWASEPALVMDGDTAHIVWVQRTGGNYSLRYRTYKLSTAALSSVETIITSGSTQDDDIGRPDIALDGDGDPHVVWEQGDAEGQRAYYRYRKSNGTWDSEFTDSLLSEGDLDKKNDHPSVAVDGNGDIIVVWSLNKSENGINERNDLIRYRRKTGGSWGGVQPLFNLSDDTVDSVSANPSVASNGGDTYAIWDEHTFQASKFRLYYKKDDDWTSGKQYTATRLPSGSVEYDSTEATGELDYSSNLRPAAFMDSDGDLHAVWHRHLTVGGGDDPVTYEQYDVMYWSTDLSKVTGVSSTEPITVATLSADGNVLGSHNAAADVAVGHYDGEWHLHVVLMVDTGDHWDVYYLSNGFYNSVYLPTVMRNNG
ncbi:MAG: hypothetical protein B6I34_00335 [Anaerolineaceae bacterium 4572_32.1]|nr:MAG: hypothetical protein B6I34_00335 [Anaerolineaceae bacterium 4572_32.1]